MEIFMYIVMFIVFWVAAAVYTILAFNVIKNVYRRRGRKEYRSDDWSRDHPAQGYEIDHRQPNFD